MRPHKLLNISHRRLRKLVEFPECRNVRPPHDHNAKARFHSADGSAELTMLRFCSRDGPLLLKLAPLAFDLLAQSLGLGRGVKLLALGANAGELRTQDSQIIVLLIAH